MSKVSLRTKIAALFAVLVLATGMVFAFNAVASADESEEQAPVEEATAQEQVEEGIYAPVPQKVTFYYNGETQSLSSVAGAAHGNGWKVAGGAYNQIPGMTTEASDLGTYYAYVVPDSAQGYVMFPGNYVLYQLEWEIVETPIEIPTFENFTYDKTEHSVADLIPADSHYHICANQPAGCKTSATNADVYQVVLQADYGYTFEDSGEYATVNWTIDPITLSLTQGARYHQQGRWGIEIVCSGLLEDALAISIDGTVYAIDELPQGVAVKSGSTIITLDTSFLSTLALGEHTLSIAYDNDPANYATGEASVEGIVEPAVASVSTTFLVLPALPVTGDSATLLVIAGAALILALACGAAFVARKRRES